MYDGILSIRNFMLVINNYFARFQLPGKLLKTKKMCSLFPWQHGMSYLFCDVHNFLGVNIPRAIFAGHVVDESLNKNFIGTDPKKPCVLGGAKLKYAKIY
jgi:hypothetical protein